MVPAQTLENDLSSAIDIIVDAAGAGDYRSINAAIAAVPDHSDERTLVFIRNGIYEEKVEIPATKRNLTIIGEQIDQTIISYDDYSGSGKHYDGILNYQGEEIGTSTSHTFYVAAENFQMMNLTVRNTAGRVGQAVAINLHGDKQSLLNVRALGNQDTFYTWGDGRFYIANSYLEGNVDFIFGRGAALFENCLIVSNRSDSDITAASTDQYWKYGYVFKACKLDGLPGVEEVSLGRPWKPYCQVVFMNSELGDHIAPEGWSKWNNTNNHETAFYAVYNNHGSGSSTSDYPDWTHQLSEEDAANYSAEKIFSKNVRPSAFQNDWHPATGENEWYQKVLTHTTDLFQDTLYYMPLIGSVYYQGKEVTDYDPRYSMYSVTIHKEEIDESAIEVKTLDPEAQVEVVLPQTIPGNAQLKITSRNGTTSHYLMKFWYEPLAIHHPSDVSVFPNPVSDHLQIDARHLRLRKVVLYDLTGAIAFEKLTNPSSHHWKLDIASLPKGVYTYRFLGDLGTVSGQLIKE